MLLLLFQLAVSTRPECQEQLRWISGGAQTEVSLIPREGSFTHALELSLLALAVPFLCSSAILPTISYVPNFLSCLNTRVDFIS